MRKSMLTLNVVLLVSSLLILSACNTNFTSSGKTIGLSVQAIDNPFFVAIQHGAEAAAAKIGARVANSCQKGTTILCYVELSGMVSKSQKHLLTSVFPAILSFMRTDVL